MKEIKEWKGLPCWEEGDYTAIFSIVNNLMVVARCKKDELNTPESIEALTKSNFWQYKSNEDVILNEKVLVLCLTERCNCHCRYCFLSADSKGINMSVDIMHKAIDYAFETSKNRKLKIAGFGGEPTTAFPLLKEMVYYANKVKAEKYPETQLSYAITTNGVMNEEIVQFLIDNNFAITLSMDGMESIQNYHRPLADGTGSYSLVVKNLRKFVEANCNINARVTVTKYSVKQMSEIVKFFSSNGIKVVHFEAMCESGRACQTNDLALQAPTPDEFAENIIDAFKTAASLGSSINCSPFVWCSGNTENRLVVGPSGMVSSCVEIQSPKSEMAPYFGMGNIDESGVHMHDNKIRHNAKIQIKDRDCSKCPYYVVCKRSCPSRNYHSTGSTCTTDTFKCEFVKKVMPYILHSFYESTYEN